MEELTNLLADLDIESTLIGVVATVVVYIVSKLPAAWKARVTKTVDKVDAELDKTKNDVAE